MGEHYDMYNQEVTSLFVGLILKICRYERKEHKKSVDEVLREPLVESLNGNCILGSIIKLELSRVLETGPFQVSLITFT